MIEQWSAVRKESNYLNSVLSDLLKEQRADIEKFTKDKELQKEYTQRVFPELLESLRRDTTCGLFLVMANDHNPGYFWWHIRFQSSSGYKNEWTHRHLKYCLNTDTP